METSIIVFSVSSEGKMLSYVCYDSRADIPI